MDSESTAMPKLKTRADDTRERIMQTAEGLFRRLGFAKTAVADIAAELKMSPANVYRFFPSKNAIVEAICKRCLCEVEGKAWAVAGFTHVWAKSQNGKKVVRQRTAKSRLARALRPLQGAGGPAAGTAYPRNPRLSSRKS